MKYFPGIYRGRVLAHLKNGKCKIHIPGVYPESFALLPSEKTPQQASSTDSTEMDIYGQPIKWPQLPDAERATGLEFNGDNKQGIFNYPRLLSYVWCMFERGDPNRPIYFATVTPDQGPGGDEFENSFFKKHVKSNSATIEGDKVNNILPLAINVGTTAIELLSTAEVSSKPSETDTQTTTTSTIKLIVKSSNKPADDLKNLEKNIPPPLASIEINSAGQIILSGKKVTIAADSFEITENTSTSIKSNSIALTGGDIININANNMMTIDTPSSDKDNPGSNTGKIIVGHGNGQIKI